MSSELAHEPSPEQDPRALQAVIRRLHVRVEELEADRLPEQPADAATRRLVACIRYLRSRGVALVYAGPLQRDQLRRSLSSVPDVQEALAHAVLLSDENLAAKLREWAAILEASDS